MSERSLTSGSGYILALVAALLLFLIIPAASAAYRRLRPAWRAWVWPLMFGGLALTSVLASVATMQGILDTGAPVWKTVNGLAGLSFTFLTLNALYRAVNDGWLARRFAWSIWLAYALFLLAVVAFDSFLTVLIYDAVSSILVFIVHSTLYARDRDRASDARSIMIGTAFILLSDLVASFDFSLVLGPIGFTQLFPSNLLQIMALVFFYLGASASYSIKYDLQRSRERLLSAVGSD